MDQTYRTNIQNKLSQNYTAGTTATTSSNNHVVQLYRFRLRTWSLRRWRLGSLRCVLRCASSGTSGISKPRLPGLSAPAHGVGAAAFEAVWMLVSACCSMVLPRPPQKVHSGSCGCSFLDLCSVKMAWCAQVMAASENTLQWLQVYYSVSERYFPMG